ERQGKGDTIVCVKRWIALKSVAEIPRCETHAACRQDSLNVKQGRDLLVDDGQPILIVSHFVHEHAGNTGDIDIVCVGLCAQ
ncbi:MAG: hypothetical protein MK319_10120, partial [Pseudomonadales bacterium]|nr:hypothetical protein [Pseudomonadales bacterium]